MNYPIGTNNDSLAPWNEIDQEVDFEMPVREVFTGCCGVDVEEDTIVCPDCCNVAEIIIESDVDFERRISRAEENALDKLK